MSKKADIWMPVYVGDYLADTSRLTTVQHGAYFLLMLDYWRCGPPPDDDAVLAQIARSTPGAWREIRKSLVVLFDVRDGFWRHKRIDSELESAHENQVRSVAGNAARWGESDAERGRELRSKRLSEARAKGTHTMPQWEALRRHQKCLCARCGGIGELVRSHIKPIYQGGSDAIENIQPLCKKCNAGKGLASIDYRLEGWENAVKNASENASSEASECLLNASTSPSPSSITTKSIARPVGHAGFDRFWEAWPKTQRKQDKKKCLDRWKSKNLEPRADAIVAHVEASKATQKWRDGFEPAPLTYLNGCRYDDEIFPDALANGHVPEWHETASGWQAKGIEVGQPQRPGETFYSFRVRLAGYLGMELSGAAANG